MKIQGSIFDARTATLPPFSFRDPFRPDFTKLAADDANETLTKVVLRRGRKKGVFESISRDISIPARPRIVKVAV